MWLKRKSRSMKAKPTGACWSSVSSSAASRLDSSLTQARCSAAPHSAIAGSTSASSSALVGVDHASPIAARTRPPGTTIGWAASDCRPNRSASSAPAGKLAATAAGSAAWTDRPVSTAAPRGVVSSSGSVTQRSAMSLSTSVGRNNCNTSLSGGTKAMLLNTAPTVGAKWSAIAAHTSSTECEPASELASLRSASVCVRAAVNSATNATHDRWLVSSLPFGPPGAAATTGAPSGTMKRTIPSASRTGVSRKSIVTSDRPPSPAMTSAS